MKTRIARKIVKSVEAGTALYPRHILRAACLQLEMDAMRIGVSSSEILFWNTGPCSCHPFVGRWIPDIITECVEVAKIVGVPVGTSDMNGHGAWITPNDTPQSAHERYRSGFVFEGDGRETRSLADQS